MFLVSGLIYSQETLTKKIEQTYSMTNAGELQLNSKHGNISITGWDKNRIAITMDVKVSHKKKENAQDLLDRINPEFKTTGDFISVASKISEKGNSGFTSYFKKVNPIEFDKSNVDINYTIHLPINAEIDITNLFGDVMIDNWTGKLKAHIEHGDLWINDTVTNAKISMKFGQLRSKSITYGVIDLKNGDIDIKQSENLLLNTSGSNIDLMSVEELELSSNKDELQITRVGKIKGELKYSNVVIDTLNSHIDLNMRVAELQVLKITDINPEVTINQESSDIEIQIKDLSFKFKAHLEEGLLRLPKTVSNIKSTVLNEANRIREITGSYGNSEAGVFSFIGEKGSIVLEE